LFHNADNLITGLASSRYTSNLNLNLTELAMSRIWSLQKNICRDN